MPMNKQEAHASMQRISGLSAPTATVLAVGVVAFALVAAHFFMGPANETINNRDEFKYVMLADSFLHGQDLTTAVGVPVQYPPGWPLVLAAIKKFDGDFRAMHRTSAALVWLGGVLTVAYAATFIPALPAIAVGLLFVTHGMSLQLGGRLMSEPLFVVFLVATLLYLRVWYSPHRRPCLLLMGLLSAACMSVRTIGVVVWVAAVANEFISGRDGSRKIIHQALMISAIPLTYVVCLTVLQPEAAVDTDNRYVHDFIRNRIDVGGATLGSLLQRTLSDLNLHARDLLTAINPVAGLGPRWNMVETIGSISVLVLAGCGIILRRRETNFLLCSVPALYLGVHFLWPYFYPRFFWPLLPLIYTFAVIGADDIRRAALPAISSNMLYLLISLAAGVIAAYNLSGTDTYRGGAAARDEAFRDGLNRSLITQAPDASQVATISVFKLKYFAPYVEIIPLPYRAEAEDYWRIITSRHAGWLLIARNHDDYFASLLAQRPTHFTETYRDSRFSLYRVTTPERSRAEP